MTYKQTLDYLYARLPMYQRIGAAAYKANLDNTLKILSLLGNPHRKIKTVHIAGTNGKGSTSHMIASVLQQAGYKTGLYTSPHLLDFRERIKINGQMIPQKKVVDFVELYKSDFEQIEPSFFEWTVGLAFDYFASQEVDVAVIETGLGGRLDSTNVINPLLSVITNIGYDHMNLLGDTLEKIASEKAGIIKPRIPVVISEQQSGIYPIFNQKATECKSLIHYADKRFKIQNCEYKNFLLHAEVLDKKQNTITIYKLDLTANYQQKNLLGVLQALHELKNMGFIIEEEDVREGLSKVTANTGLQGRWQVLKQKPLVIADTAHNPDGIKLALQNIERHAPQKLHIVFGTVNDKDINTVLPLLPKNAFYYFVQASVPRALEADILYRAAQKHKLRGHAYDSVEKGLNSALKAAGKNDMVFIGGSTFVVADALLLQTSKATAGV